MPETQIKECLTCCESMLPAADWGHTKGVLELGECAFDIQYTVPVGERGPEIRASECLQKAAPLRVASQSHRGVALALSSCAPHNPYACIESRCTKEPPCHSNLSGCTPQGRRVTGALSQRET